jgi:hypothetical protein
LTLAAAGIVTGLRQQRIGHPLRETNQPCLLSLQGVLPEDLATTGQ